MNNYFQEISLNIFYCFFTASANFDCPVVTVRLIKTRATRSNQGLEKLEMQLKVKWTLYTCPRSMEDKLIIHEQDINLSCVPIKQ